MLHVLIAGTLQQPQCSRRDVELCDVVLCADVPVSAEVRVCWRAFKDNSGNTKEQRRIDDIRVASDPADVATAEEDIRVVNVENVLAGHCCAEQVAGSRVHDTLGLAGRARGVEKEERVFRVHGLRCNVRGPLLGLLMPPPIPALSERHIGAGALSDQTVRHIRALLKRLVDDLLGANELATAFALVRGDHHLGLGVDNSVAERV